MPQSAYSSRVSSSNAIYSEPTVINPANLAYVRGKSSHIAMPFNALLILLIIALLAIGSLQLFFVGQSWLTSNELEQHGVNTQAKVSDHRFYKDNKGFQHYNLTYTFETVAPNTSQPRTYKNEVGVSQATYNQYQPGAKITVRYVSADPTNSEVANQVGNSDANILLALAGLWLYFGAGVLLWFVLQRWKLHRTLERRGQLIIGKYLSGQAKKGFSTNWHHTFEIQYQFVTPQGRLISDKEVYAKDLWLSPETPVVVIYADDKHYKLL